MGSHFKIRRGLSIPIAGEPEQRIYDAQPVTSVAIVGDDYHGRKRLPTVLVEEGDRVKLGQPLSRSKTRPEVVATSPGAGIVENIRRGERRFVHTISVRLDGDDQETYNRYGRDELNTLNREQVRDNLLASGLWLAFRGRPYGFISLPEVDPHAIFVNAMDTRPLAPDPAIIIAEAADDFADGMTVISKLTSGKVYLCGAPGNTFPKGEAGSVVESTFEGPHPAGLPGTHIHFLAPVSATRTVWYLGYQDVIAIGRLFKTGRLPVERIVSLAGPAVKRPRLLRTRLGANTNELIDGELVDAECRVVSGSVLGGRRAVSGWAFLGRYHNQITVLKEGRTRELFSWIRLGFKKYSESRVFVSNVHAKKQFDLTTSQNGSPRALVPTGNYERVMPLDILPTQLLRALLVEDIDTAQALGCLELEEEDLALCSFVCTGKHDFGPILRENLQRIWKEG